MINYCDVIIDTLEKVCQEAGKNIKINLDDSLDKLGINSMTFMVFVVQIEKKFGIEFDDDYLVIEQYYDIESLVDYICSLIE